MKNQAAIERELHDAKIRDYIDNFEEKNLFRREKNMLYRNKQAVQQMERTEHFFLKEL